MMRECGIREKIMHCEVIDEPEASLIRNGSNVLDKSSYYHGYPRRAWAPLLLKTQLDCIDERLTELLVDFEGFLYLHRPRGLLIFTTRWSGSKNVVSEGRVQGEKWENFLWRSNIGVLLSKRAPNICPASSALCNSDSDPWIR